MIPKNCYIDYRDFNNDEKLFDYLNNISIEEANKYLLNAHNYLNSKKVNRNLCEYFTAKILSEISNFQKNN